MTNTFKVGKLPGRLVEVAVAQGTTFKQALSIAGVEKGSFELKADGVTVTNLDAPVPAGTASLLLTAKVKGNAFNVKVGKLPGRLVEVGLVGGESFNKALEIAGVSVGNFEVKADGVTVTNLNATVPTGTASILLTAKVKGNAFTVKVGKLPGRLVEVGLTGSETYKQVFQMAGVSVGTFEVKADGATITNFDAVVRQGTASILLTAKVKGNK